MDAPAKPGHDDLIFAKGGLHVLSGAWRAAMIEL
jgi:hypothetical protein